MTPIDARDETISGSVAAWVSHIDFDMLPSAAIDLAILGVQDCIGVTLAGSCTSPARITRELIGVLGGRPHASVLGTTLKTNVALAALVNGTAAHSLDFDDTNHPLHGHPSSHLVPTLLALSEWQGASGRDFLTAYLTGFELEVRLARALNMSHYVAGWHATATLGTLGAAAAAARLLGLGPTATRNALGIAASFAGGMRENFGTDTKPLHAGIAAERGVMAALLAHRGLNAANDPLGGRFGFCSLFAGGADPRLEELDPARFGHPWEITTQHGLAIKQFPSCGATHPAIEAAIAARADRRLTPDQIRRVRVGTSELGFTILAFKRPKSGLEGKFSLEYCVATALLDGSVTVEHFEDDAVVRGTIQALLPRIEVAVDDRVRDDREYAAIVELELIDGTRQESRVDVAKGNVVRPLSAGDIAAKYRACARRVLPASQVAESLDMVQRLAELETTAELVACLVVQ